MSNDFQKALSLIREKSNNDKELGDYFERLCKVFFENDDVQKQYFSEVYTYSEWAKSRPEYSSFDIGIDLVAKLRDEDGYASIQCKCYSDENRITKEDLDSFISASSSKDFKRLILVDTSLQSLGKNAQKVFDVLDKEFYRIQITELESSRIDWLHYLNANAIRLSKKNLIRDHQIKALDAVQEGFEESDRGKLIMACGTGKTFTSLKIAEKLAGKGKFVLYMVPSLSLMSQTVSEWKKHCEDDFYAYSACSDVKVGKRKINDDTTDISLSDLAFPATTDSKKLSEHIVNLSKDKMIVVFSTYQSIEVISKSQKEFNLPEFDLIICDEAHRTTGVTLSGDDESSFVKIHNNEDIAGKKRLYMTATPRIYGENAKQKADEVDASLASMDDETKFGKTFFHRGFGWAVENNLLTDYKVVVLAVDESIVSSSLQRNWLDGSELKLDDATKIIGCYKALAKIGLEEEKTNKKVTNMKSAIAFCQSIAISKLFENEFLNVINEYLLNEKVNKKDKIDLKVEISHIDGTFNAVQRNDRLSWLSDETQENTCRILSNVKCLSEGVDVPALDAVIFLHPRKSQTDIVQSVGRVMRRAEGKDFGYVIIPITISPGVSPERALDDNDRYKTVWQILNALRSHDERLDSTINKIGLGEDISDKIEIVSLLSDELDATTTVINDIKTKTDSPTDKNDSEDTDDTQSEEGQDPYQYSLIEEDLVKAIRAKIVDKCGTRDYWEKWANDIAKIAQQHITRITSIVLNSKSKEREIFLKFLEEIQDDLNPEITENDAVEMLAQHIITKPVFDVLFKDNKFTSENAVSKAMQKVLDQVYKYKIENESESLQKFYKSVERRSSDIVTAAGRQTLILELYDRFFKNSFPLTTERMGIVYTPVEVVDFIIHSVGDLLKQEFNKTFNNKNVNILDPFSGTGTFITRLLQSGEISKDVLHEKYKNNLYANEIILLAYYIASINIESVFYELMQNDTYESFSGMVLTDTFQLYEQEKDMIADLLPDNSNRRTSQKEKAINIVISNPPYSAGQLSANDNAANIKYPNLDRRIETTYAFDSQATLKHDLYDSYIRAFRWASDRIGDEGVIGFVTNAGWVDGNSTDGFRKHLAQDFNKIYIFHLRGNQRTSGELSRREGGKIFGSGSRSPIAITFLVKNTADKEKGQIYFYDIGDYLSRDKKLEIISNFKSIVELEKQNKLIKINPDEDNDWINQGNKLFKKYPRIGGKKSTQDEQLFIQCSNGILTSRDAWCYNFSKSLLSKNIERTISAFNHQVEQLSQNKITQTSFDKNPKNISWSRSLIARLNKQQIIKSNDFEIRNCMYRPFIKTQMCFSKELNEMRYQIKELFPCKDSLNTVIAVSGTGSKNFSALMLNVTPDYNMLEGGAQCFPLKIFRSYNSESNDLFVEDESNKYNEIDGISDFTLSLYQSNFKDASITKENIFYYIYGILYSKDYVQTFCNNLSKDLPRIPFTASKDDFFSISNAGRLLGNLHVNYEDVEPYPVQFKEGDLRLATIDNPSEFFKVKKMKFISKNDKTRVFYNNNLTIENIPLDAYKFQINGKSPIEWLIDRIQITTDKQSGINNDPNLYATETLNNPKYPLELFQKIITVSIETVKIIDSMPKLTFK
jgi:predicted helicase